MYDILGLLGYPVSHSLSPKMHNRIIKDLGLEMYYTLFSVPPARLKEAMKGVQALGIRGLNVTAPYKEEVIPYLDRLSPFARMVGAVNTIRREGDTLTGYNTDGWGFIQGLQANGFRSVEKVLILGAGGAARAVAHALLLTGVRKIIVSNRTAVRARELVERLKTDYQRYRDENFPADFSEDFPLKPNLPPSFSAEWIPLKVYPGTRAIYLPGPFEPDELEVELIVNATCVGMEGGPEGLPVNPDIFRPGQRVYDLIYNPAKTQLLKTAESKGAEVAGGVTMLVYQGALAFQLWTGHFPSNNILDQLCRDL